MHSTGLQGGDESHRLLSFGVGTGCGELSLLSVPSLGFQCSTLPPVSQEQALCALAGAEWENAIEGQGQKSSPSGT